MQVRSEKARTSKHCLINASYFFFFWRKTSSLCVSNENVFSSMRNRTKSSARNPLRANIHSEVSCTCMRVYWRERDQLGILHHNPKFLLARNRTQLVLLGDVDSPRANQPHALLFSLLTRTPNDSLLFVAIHKGVNFFCCNETIFTAIHF